MFFFFQLDSSYFISVIFCDFRPASLYKAEDLSNFKASGDVFVDVCSAVTPVQLMLDRGSKRVREGFITNINISFLNKWENHALTSYNTNTNNVIAKM